MSETGPQVVATGGTYKWTYDPNGNLTSQIGDDGYPVTYTYTQAITPNQLQTMVMGDGQPTASYAYDGHGDTTAITDGNTLNTHLVYDSQARPVQITKLDHRMPLTVTLTYNPSGQRASYHVVEPGQPTLDQQFTYRNGMLGQVRLTSGATAYTDTYLYTDAGAPYELLRTNGSGATSRYWYEVDGRGNVVALTDITGKVVDRYAYDSWGELTSNDATDEMVPQQLRYAGYWYDEKLSWYWLNVRYYDPEIERFLQPDPSEQDGVRTYAYVGDDPIDWSDPSGLSSPAPTPTTTPGTKTPAPVPSSQIGPCGQHGPQLAYCHAPANSQNWVVVARCLDRYAPYSSAYVAASGGQPICGATWPGLGTVTEDLPPSGYIDPFLVRFTQDSANWYFKDRTTGQTIGTVGDLVNGLRSGTIKPTDLPPINVVLKNGGLWSLDNRRLEAFRRAGVPIRYKLINWSQSVVDEWNRKFTTNNNGESIRLRGEPEAPADPGQLVDPIEPIEPIEPIV